MTVLLDLDRKDALHLAVALDVHRKTCRAQGVSWTDTLEEIAAMAWRIAKGDSDRQEPTSLAELAAVLFGERVPPLLCTVEEAAKALGVSTRHVERLVKEGKLPSVTIGRNRRIRCADVERFVADLVPGRPPLAERVETKTAAPAPPPTRPGSRRGGLGPTPEAA